MPKALLSLIMIAAQAMSLVAAAQTAPTATPPVTTPITKTSTHIRVAAASDLKFALDEIKAAFLKTHPGATIEIVLGSSGQFEQQIEKGAPFDVFLSADEVYPNMLIDKKIVKDTPWVYGRGTLVMWTSKPLDVSRGLSLLRDPLVKKVAIANPDHAPYGRAAREALTAAGVWNDVQSKIVKGDSISQTAQFAQTGAADIALIALALARSPQMKGTYAVVTEAKPLVQSGVVVSSNPLAAEFLAYVIAEPGQAVLTKYGFKGP